MAQSFQQLVNEGLRNVRAGRKDFRRISVAVDGR
jgi:hypothetical protein